MRPDDASLPVLGGIGIAAGLLGAVFGVGGGLIIVPLLLRFAAYDPRRATATSLAAIVCMAAFGAACYGVSGHVHWGDALLVGLPAIVGVLVGTSLQKRLAADQLTLLFAALLVVLGVRLIVA